MPEPSGPQEPELPRAERPEVPMPQPSAPPGMPSTTPPPTTPPPPPPGRPNLWRQATSTTGGKVAVIVAACLVALLLLGMVGAAALVTARVIAGHRQDRIENIVGGRSDDQLPPGQRKKLQRQMPMPDLPGDRNGNGLGKGNGLGPLMRGAQALGNVQHGEFTVQGTDGKSTVMTLQRGTVTTASATSVAVKSDDGFTATYAVDSSTRGAATTLAKGDSVLVLAQKSGAKAVMIRATR